MRRLLRIFLSAATVLSLTLCTATVAVWIRSHRVCDNFTRRDSVRPSGVRIQDVCSKDGVFVWAMESRRIGSHSEGARGGCVAVGTLFVRSPTHRSFARIQAAVEADVLAASRFHLSLGLPGGNGGDRQRPVHSGFRSWFTVLGNGSISRDSFPRFSWSVAIVHRRAEARFEARPLFVMRIRPPRHPRPLPRLW